jgi:hypothetical protein
VVRTTIRELQAAFAVPLPANLDSLTGKVLHNDQMRGVCVPHVVHPEMRESSRPQDRLEESPELSRCHRLSDPRREYPRHERGLAGDHRFHLDRRLEVRKRIREPCTDVIFSPV